MPKILNWRFIDCTGNRISLEQAQSGLDDFYLQGNIIDDYRFLYGELIHTTPVKKYAEDLSWAETKNTRYILGEMMQENELPKEIILPEEVK